MKDVGVQICINKYGVYIMKNRLSLLLIVVIVLVTGCRPTPSTTLINNNLNDEHQTIGADEGEPREVTLNTVEINDTIELEDRTVTISGQAIVPDSYEGLYSYNFTQVDDSYEEEMMFLFGEYEQYAQIYETPLPDGIIVRRVEVNLENDGYWAAIYYGDYFERFQDVIWSEEDAYITMSHEESLEKANEIGKRIGVPEEYIYTETVEEEAYMYTESGTPLWQSEFRDLKYYTYLQNIPLKIESENCFEIPCFSVEFFSQGVKCVSFYEATYEKGYLLENILTLDDVVGILQNKLALSNFDEINTITQIEFAYGGKNQTDDGKYEVVPFWYITTNEREIIIDAVTGKVEYWG